MSMLGLAIKFAALHHATQLDKGGHPYILHPLRMMMRLRTTDDELMAIAVLHDIVEDCDVTFADLSLMGMSPRVVEGVRALTKQAGETYDQFIDRVLLNRDAAIVKREDLKDNADLTRLKGVSEKDIERMQKYMRAFRRLDSALQARKEPS